MNKKLFWILVFASILMAAGCVICYTFDTTFAELTIDWVAFIAGIFLMVEASWKIFTTKDPFFPNQLLRTLRAVIGVNIFTIHLLQFMRF